MTLPPTRGAAVLAVLATLALWVVWAALLRPALGAGVHDGSIAGGAPPVLFHPQEGIGQ